MGTVYNPSIIQDGLTLHLDAGNPQSWSPNRFPTPLDIGASVALGTNHFRDPSKKSPAGGIPLKTISTISTINIGPSSTILDTTNARWIISFWVYTATTIPRMRATLARESSSLGGFIGSPAYGGQWTRIALAYGSSSTATTKITGIALYAANDAGAPTAPGTEWWIDGLQVEMVPSSWYGSDPYATDWSKVSSFVPYTNTKWNDLGPLKTPLELKDGTPYHNYISGSRAFEWNASAYFQSTTADGQLTDYRYGATIEMWLYASSTAPTARSTVFEKVGGTSGATTLESYQTELAVSWNTSNTLDYYRHYAPTTSPIYNNPGAASYDNASIAAMTAGQWNHVVIVLNPHLSSGIGYLNGVVSGAYSQRAWLLPSQGGAIRVGNGYAGVCNAGAIATLRTYSKIFDADDVKYNYNVTKIRFGL